MFLVMLGFVLLHVYFCHLRDIAGFISTLRDPRVRRPEWEIHAIEARRDGEIAMTLSYNNSPLSFFSLSYVNLPTHAFQQ
jgi:hypothetical protein